MAYKRKGTKMDNANYKQIAVITANSATTFEQRVNAILKHVINPRIVFEKSRPLMAYIVYEEERKEGAE